MNRFGKTVIIVNAVILSVLPASCGVFLGPDPDNSPRGIFDRIWEDFDETYALMNVKGIDWNNAYDTHIEKITSGMNEQDLFDVCSGLPGELNDPHVYLMSPFKYFNSGGRFDTPDMEPFNIDVIKDYLDDGGVSAEGVCFCTGHSYRGLMWGIYTFPALRTQDHVTHTGSKTNGAFSLSLERTLINGWIYSVSVQKVTDMAGNCYEGTGIAPDVPQAADITGTVDVQLAYALEYALTKTAPAQ